MHNNSQNEESNSDSQSQTPQLVDMEQVFFRLHARIVRSFTSIYGTVPLRIAEWASLVVALSSLVALIWIHLDYSYTSPMGASVTCLSGILEAKTGGALWSTNNNQEQMFDLVVVADDYSNQFTPMEANRGSNNDTNLYSFSRDRGLLVLSPEYKEKYRIKETVIHTSELMHCIGGEVSRNFITWTVGFETILVNMFVRSTNGTGYVHRERSKEILNLEHYSNLDSNFVFKFGVLATSLFLVLVTTTLVHHTLRETQERMLRFTDDLKQHIIHDIPYGALVMNHILGSLVFVPSMAGMLFFLVEFYNDHLMAFTVLSLVWCCEAYSSISLRTRLSISTFPKLFLVYFTAFHVYFFSFPLGFSHLALLVFVLFQIHSLLFFWSRYEVPALLNGAVNARSSRYVSLSPQSSPVMPRRLRSASAVESLTSPTEQPQRSTDLEHEVFAEHGGEAEVPRPRLVRRRHSLGTPVVQHHGNFAAMSQQGTKIPTRHLRNRKGTRVAFFHA